MIFRSIVEIMAVIYVALVLKDRSYLPTKNKILLAFLGFTLAFSATTIFSVDKYQSFWGTLERMGGLWSFIHYFVYFVILTAVMRTREQWYRLLEIMVGVSVLSSLYGFGQRTDTAFFVGSGGRERIFGTLGNPALFGGYELLNIFLALALFLRPENSNNKKIFLGGAIVINCIALIMTAVRGSILGLGVGALIFAALYFWQNRTKVAKVAFLSMIALSVFAVIVLITPLKNSSVVQDSRLLKRLSDTSFESYTAKTRFWAWEAGLTGWKENIKTMALGWGPENFNIPFSKHFNPQFYRGPGSETLFDRAHNMFIEILVTMGVIGLGLYLWIFFETFKNLIRLLKNPQEKYFAMAFVSMLAAYLIHNSFIFDTSANFLVFFSILGFISYLSFGVRKREEGTAPLIKVSFIKPITVVLGVAVAVLVYNTNILPVRANYAVTRGIIASWDNNLEGALAKHKESLNHDTFGKYDYRHRLAQFILEYYNGKPVDAKGEEEIKYAIEEVKKNITSTPDYLPYLYVSRLYVTLGKADPKSPYNDEALKYSLQALDISPKFVRTYYEIGQAYLNKKDFDSAISYFTKAAELNPKTPISYWYLGSVVAEVKDTKEGMDLIQKALDIGYSPTESEYARIINGYLKLGNYPRIIENYKNLITLKPENPQYHASLAFAYSKVGKIFEATQEAKQAAFLDPNFEGEARAFVQLIGGTW
jgi:tetratricopeptide (TPR) repeat protein